MKMKKLKLIDLMRIRWNVIPLLLLSGFFFLSTNLKAQDNLNNTGKTVSGIVYDENGETLPGVNVILKGRSGGTITDSNGSFKLKVSNEKCILSFSFIGYQNQTVTVKEFNQPVIVKLQEDAIKLDETVVVGYATQTKRKITSAITSIKSSDLSGYIGSTLEQSIEGLAPGVRISTADATPGGEIDVQIRGIGTVTSGTKPLYIVDGIPLEGGLGSLNVNDVDNIQILKDAASTAVYGSRGANGVFLITTKRGTESKPVISLNVTNTLSQAQRKYSVMNTPQLLAFLNGNGVSPTYLQTTNLTQDYFPFNSNINTDWQDAIFQNAYTQKYNLSISGGTKDIHYRISGEMFDQPGVVIYTGMSRYTFRSNLDINLTKWMKVAINFSPSFWKNRTTKAGGEGSNGVIRSAIAMYPFFPVYLPNGDFFSTVDYNLNPSTNSVSDPVTGKFDPSVLKSTPLANNIENPVHIARDYYNTSNKKGMNGGVNFDITLANGLIFKPSFSYNEYVQNDQEWYPASLGFNNTDSYASSKIKNQLMWINENILTYKKDFGNHSLTAVAGITFQQTTTEVLNAKAYKFATEALPSLNGGIINGGGYDITDNRMLSYLGRVEYSYKNRYLFSGIFRADGSTRFGANNRFGYFPSASAGWVVSEEDFMKSQDFISELKLRASWGISGNNDIGDFNYFTKLGQNNYINANDMVMGWAPTNIANPDLKWEKNNQLNLGVDIGLFGNKFFFQADYYKKITTDMLLNTQVPSTLGVTKMLQNVGSVENEGIEFNFVSRNLTNVFKWTTSFNISFNKNLVTALNLDVNAIYDGINESNITKVGYPVGMFYGRVTKGIYQSMNEINALKNDPYSGLGFDPNIRPGDIKWVDLNGDGVIDDNDRAIIGNPNPIFVAGLVNTFEYKNLVLRVQLSGQYGNQIYNYSLHQFLRGFGTNKSTLLNDHWISPEQPGNGMADRWASSSDVKPAADKNKFCNRELEDGSYLTIRNIQLVYNFDNKLIQKIGLQDLKLNFNVDNAFTFTKYTGLNPESNSMTSTTAPGIDQIGYHISRNFSIGLNIIFK